MIQLIRQVVMVTLFSLRSIGQRKGAAFSAGVGIAGVVGVFVGVLSIAEGVRVSSNAQGPRDIAIVLRKSAQNESQSSFSRDEVRLISETDGVARTADGPLASGEVFRMISMPKKSSGTDANLPLRGVEQATFPVRGDIQFLQGRNFEPGKNEVIVGAGAYHEYSGLEVGDTIDVGKNLWTVVGVFTGGGGSAESEVWTDTATLHAAFQRQDYKSVCVKLSTPESFEPFKKALEDDPRFQATAMLLSDYYASSTLFLKGFIYFIGVAISSMMALGAIFGAMNTMYNAVSTRKREIATLRALGFGTIPVVVSVLVESVVIAVLGGAAGALVAYLLFDGFQASTINFGTFTQLAFAFRVTPILVTIALFLAVIVGLFGGLLPAIRAARLPIASALREV